MNILAIGAHPDDIEIGCGGTLIRAAREGHDIYIYVITHGEVGGSAEQRMKELFVAANYIRAKKLWLDNFPDARLAANMELIYHIEWIINQCNPNLILTHSKHDAHHDHRAVSICSIEAGRKIPNVLAYENPVSRQFNAQVYVDISQIVEDKMSLIRSFSSQNHKDYATKMAIRGLAEYRALQSRNTQYISHAEAFEVIKLTLGEDFALFKMPVVTSLPHNLKYDVSKILDAQIGTKKVAVNEEP